MIKDLFYRLMNKLDFVYLEIIDSINNLWNFYSTILSLPMIYVAKNYVVLLLIIIIALSSIYFNLCFRLDISFSNEISYVLIAGVILNLLLIKFNLIVRAFNVLIKTTHYFINNKTKFNIIFSYYSFNIVCFIVLISLVNCIEINLINYDLTIGEHTQIYTYLFSIIFAVIYLEHTITDNIDFNKVKMNKLSKILSIVFIFSLSYTIFIYITNVFNPILCDSTSSDNHQINRNTQNSDIPNNDQSNGNNQTSNKDSALSTSRTNDKKFFQNNTQANVNIQTFNSNSMRINGKVVSPFTGSSDLIEDEDINLDNMLIKFNYYKNQYPDFPAHDLLFNKLRLINPNLIHYKKNYEVHLLTYNLNFKNSQLISNSEVDFKTLSFFDLYFSLKSTFNNLLIPLNYNESLNKLLNYTIEQDQHNKFLVDLKKHLLSSPNNILIFQNNFIYLHNSFSTLIKDPFTNLFNPISIKASNYLELYLNNKDIINNLYEQITEINKYPIKIETFDIPSQLTKFRTHINLNNLLVNKFSDEIKFNFYTLNYSPDFISINYNQIKANTFVHFPNSDLFIYKLSGKEEFIVKIVNSEMRLFNALYQEYKDFNFYKENETLFYIENPPHLDYFYMKYQYVLNNSKNNSQNFSVHSNNNTNIQQKNYNWF
uniref:hypothetical protein n=1 Tax=Inonotus hispidus TaxID=40469 RepID=UPI0021823857|nr:hypothetical protein N4M07_mgp033 [Inonotus hispidus]UVF38019.1 hypothetical protein [Inonotus hispidus]